MNSDNDFRSAAAELARAVRGQVLLPEDSGYDAEWSGYNIAVVQSPAIIVSATSSADVREAVLFGVRQNLPVAVQATGHAPQPSDGAVLVTTRQMNGVEIDASARTARVEAGTVWRQVVEAAVKYGLAPLNGAAPSVGAVSYTLGGGVGPLARSFGYAADHVRSLTIVTADGVERLASPEENQDLFWAVRGGKNNFGIVTSIVVDLFPVSALYGGGLYFLGSAAREVLRAYSAWTETVPDEMTSSVALLRLPPDPTLPDPLRGKYVTHVRIAYNGPETEGERLVAPLRSIAPLLIASVGVLPYSQVGTIHNDPPGPIPFIDTTALLSEFSAGTADAIADLEPSATLVEIRHLGGALSREPKHANAVGNRDAAFLVYAVSIVPPQLLAGAAEDHAQLHKAIQPWKTQGVAYNFASDPTLTQNAFSTETYARLAEVKAQRDPANLFRVNLNIPPTVR
ncbi:FAD-binding oxidoreductase [Amycolatopsis sp. NPDC049253]|uniref:FAD-binding oxidoreductase n=1 Tax=Amycolatopsis sp. NPDC049253 TaxID=3155274 RepID=UPI00342DE288